MKVAGYIIGVAVIGVVIAGSIYAPKIMAKGTTWGPTQSAKVDQIINRPNGHVSYGIVESSGAVGEITVTQACGISIGDTVLYQDRSDYQDRRVISPASCQAILNGE